MGVFSFLGRLFGGGGAVGAGNLPRPQGNLPGVNQNAITPQNFQINYGLYASSQLTSEANNRGWIVDDELVQQSAVIAQNATNNAKNTKALSRNVKKTAKAELSSAKDMAKIITLVAGNDAKKYGQIAKAQGGLDASSAVYHEAVAQYQQQVQATNERINEALNFSQQRRDKLRGR